MNAVTAATPDTQRPFADVIERLRQDFPILSERQHGKPIAYLDNAASSQRPRAVIQAIAEYYEHDHANVHRGVHLLSQRATERFEDARETVRGFINARSTQEIIFTRGTTEAINLVAQSLGRRFGEGDEVLISHMEHHSNIVPWQLMCEQTGATLKVVPITPEGELDMHAYEQLLSPRTAIVALVHISNALGTINPVEQCIRLAHDAGAVVLLDGAQAVPHTPVDMQALDCDFYVFSGHKMFAPTGSGVLYGKQALLEDMPPWQGGGDMILQVTFEKSTYAPLPAKFEAGTPNIAGAVGLAAAIEYIQSIGFEQISAIENALLRYATHRVSEVPGLRLVGTAREKASVLSFVMDDIHAHDIGTILDHHAVAVRTGHHCAMPVMDYFNVPATSRASFAFYNTYEEADRLVDALHAAREVFA